MKLRTDFVTNSSSSSFILVSKDIAKYRDEAKIMCENGERDLYTHYFNLVKTDGNKAELIEAEVDNGLRFMNQKFNEMLENILPMENYSTFAIREVFRWYFDDIMKKLFADYPVKGDFERNSPEYEKKAEIFSKSLETRPLTDKEREKAACIIYLTVADAFYDPEEKIEPPFTAKQIEAYFNRLLNEHLAITRGYSCIEDQEFWENYIYSDEYGIVGSLMLNDREQMLSIVKSFAGLNAGAVFGKLTGADYMFLDWEEMDWYVYKTLSSKPECLYACNHMG